MSSTLRMVRSRSNFDFCSFMVALAEGLARDYSNIVACRPRIHLPCWRLMPTFGQIRDLYREPGINIGLIARHAGHGRRSVDSCDH